MVQFAVFNPVSLEVIRSGEAPADIAVAQALNGEGLTLWDGQAWLDGNGDTVALVWPSPNAVPAGPAYVLRSQIIRALAHFPDSGGDPWITEAEALAWSADASALPALIIGAIAALPAGERLDATILARTFQTVDRVGPMSGLIQSAFGASDEQRDALFVLADSL